MDGSIYSVNLKKMYENGSGISVISAMGQLIKEKLEH